MGQFQLFFTDHPIAQKLSSSMFFCEITVKLIHGNETLMFHCHTEKLPMDAIKLTIVSFIASIGSFFYTTDISQ